MEVSTNFKLTWGLRWRIWRRDIQLMETIARGALMRIGVCDETDSLVRCVWDKASGQLIVMVYLAQFDHAAWSMSRHIEHYLVRQFKGLYHVGVHSVHMSVTRAKAFKEIPEQKSATPLRALLRERRKTGVKTNAVTGLNIAKKWSLSHPQFEEAFAKTVQAELGELPPSRWESKPSVAGLDAKASKPAPRKLSKAQVQAPRKLSKAQVQAALLTEEYLSVPGYEISEVNFEEFLSSVPAPKEAGVSRAPAAAPLAPAASKPAPSLYKGFPPEADVLDKAA